MTGRKDFCFSDLEDDVFIPTANLNRALDKDIVKVYVYNRRKGKRPEGEVIEVVERHKTDFVGVDIQKTLHLYLQQILKCIQIFYSKDKNRRARRCCISSYRRLA
jgi:ribonuclease R